MVFPINRPTQRSINKQTSICKQRILSTPSHPWHFYKPERAQNIDEEHKKLPSLLPERLI